MASSYTTAKATNTDAIGMVLTLRFVLWMQAQGDVPTAPQIASHFGLSRATGYRWRARYLDAIGQIDTQGTPQ